eukprot:Skav223609  [mRNA]  locus=scaffold1522:29818:35386:- [translate_table: standard]
MPRHDAAVARTLYFAAWRSKVILQQQRVKVLCLGDVFKHLTEEMTKLTHRVERSREKHGLLIEAVRDEEQNLAMETGLKEEELKLLRILAKRRLCEREEASPEELNLDRMRLEIERTACEVAVRAEPNPFHWDEIENEPKECSGFCNPFSTWR